LALKFNSQINLKDYKSFFLIGIGGAGMSAIALVLKGMGFEVFGSDLKESGYTKILKEKSINVIIGHNPKNIFGADAIIYSAAIREDNVEYTAALKEQIPLIARSDALAWILNRSKGITIAGTHGKTTTTSMLSLILKDSGLDPTIIIGGELNELGTNASFGKGEFTIAEACESDGSFMKYTPYISIVTNIEEDHMDFYHDFKTLKDSFYKFMKNTKSGGFLAINGDEINVENIIEGAGFKIFTFGLSDKNDVYASDIVFEDGSLNYMLCFKDKSISPKAVNLKVIGNHNVKNSLAALSAAFLLNLDIERSIKSLRAFTGVKRRFEKRGQKNGAMIFDDYAHHPSEVSATLEAAALFKKNRLIAIFQPHRYSRLKALYDKFSSCFEKSDILVITDVYSSGESPLPGINGKILVDEIIAKGFDKKIAYIPKISDIADYIEDFLRKEDIVIVMGAGDITRVSDELIK